MVLDIYNKFNREKVTIDQINPYFNNDLFQIPETDIYTYGTYFAHEIVVEFDNFTKFIRGKEAKPYYLPNEWELFKYIDDEYFEKTEAYHKLHNYARKHIYANDYRGASYFCKGVYMGMKYGVSIDAIMTMEFERMQIELEDEMQSKVVYGLLLDLNRDVRDWENNGYTERELSAMNQEQGPPADKAEKGNVVRFRSDKNK